MTSQVVREGGKGLVRCEGGREGRREQGVWGDVREEEKEGRRAGGRMMGQGERKEIGREGR